MTITDGMMICDDDLKCHICHSYREYVIKIFVTSFLLPVFSGKVFLEATTATATKFLVGVVAKKRWQKRGDKKEVVQR